LVENYEVTDPRHYQYFTVHEAADREHAAAERALLDQCVNDDNAATTANAVDRILSALWEMLSGVCRRHAIACG